MNDPVPWLLAILLTLCAMCGAPFVVHAVMCARGRHVWHRIGRHDTVCLFCPALKGAKYDDADDH